MELKDKKVLVIGMAKSGISAALYCNKKGADVTVSDSKTKEELKDVLEPIYKTDIKLELGKKADDLIDGKDLIIISPGVPRDISSLIKADKLNIPVIGEIELAYRFCKAKVLAITGTNGKTTTTMLTGAIMKEYSNNVEIVGNIGVPFADKVDDLNEKGWAVAEISSFQMETAYEFKPFVSAVLNITPDHLNRHKTLENYVSEKEKIFRNQKENDFCILNYDDEYCRKMAQKTKAKVIFFSTKEILEEGIYLQNDVIKLKFSNIEQDLLNINEMKIFGNHNIQNAMAAIGITYSAGVPKDIIKKVVTEFKAVEHRIEYVATVDGVEYYNDSKGTNPDAAIQAVKAMKKQTVLIGGGYDKGSDFTEWIEAFNGKIKKLILIGATAQKIKDTAERLGYMECEIVETFEQAMDLARKTAVSGECVLLSPACASWGMFENYEQRGEIFKNIVHSYEKSSL